MRGLAAGFLALLVVAIPAVAAAQQQPAAADTLVTDVLRMLDAEVSEESIRSWVEVSGRRPAEVTPDDIIALERAGASPALVMQLLELAPRDPAADEAPVEVGPPILPDTAVPPPRAVAPAPTAEATFEIDYRPEVEEGARGWRLYAYLDGELLTWSDGGFHVIAPNLTEVRRELRPGRHVLRLLQEQHVAQSIGRPWRHSARVLPEPLELDVEAGEEWRVEVRFIEQRLPFTGAGPGVVSWVVFRDGDLVEERRNLGPPPYDWPNLCEEVKTELPPEKWDSRRGRRALEGCVEWRELFAAATGDVPSRESVREMMEQYDFRPVPAE